MLIIGPIRRPTFEAMVQRNVVQMRDRELNMSSLLPLPTVYGIALKNPPTMRQMTTATKE